LDRKGYFDEGLDGNKEYGIENLKRGHISYKVAKRLAELCLDFSALQSEIGHLPEETFKQTVEGVVWILLTSYSKMI
jgi:hypothetical protein